MGGFKYLAGTTVGIFVVLLGFSIVLAEFNSMIYPARITAFSLSTVEKGICQVEFLGEKAQLPIPEFEPAGQLAIQGRQMIVENSYQVLERGRRLAAQMWDGGIKALPLKDKSEQLLNIIKTGLQELLPMQE